MGHMTEIPEGMSPDARDSWPSRALIQQWLGDFDFELRPGEDVSVPPDDPEAQAAARRFRDVLGRFATGVTVITATSGGEPVGMTCQSFSSVSLTPPLVLFCPAKTSRAWPLIRKSGKFAINLLAEGQEGISNTMATKGIDKFADVSWQPSPITGSPLIDGTLGYIDCSVHAVHEAGDHYIVVGLVKELESKQATEPLIFSQGKYRSLAD